MVVLGIAAALALAPAAGAQRKSGGEGTPPPSRPSPVSRADWLSDRVPIGVGEILTVVVDEQTAARERVSQVAIGNRTLRGSLKADLDGDAHAGGVSSDLGRQSHDTGEASRTGDLTAVLSVRVVGVESGGVLRVEGRRDVTVDGRQQLVTLSGVVRAEDVTSARTVLSSRIAEAVITYKGRKIGPRAGIIGSILSVLWP
jgi:flagellar L-ring protein precursor FlgH